jgi:phosphopantothenoylcysteine decarboxylase / phosphopantothenate---cysteine ligase
VILVHSTLPDLPIDRRIQSIPVVTSEEMQHALLAHFPPADLVLMAAAVADVKPASYNVQKLAKKLLPTALELAPVPDIIAELGNLKQPHQKLIGFAAQTGDIITPALEKLHRKQLDAIVANPVDLPGSGFGSDRNQAVLIAQNGNQTEIPICTKLQMAHLILDQI